MFRSCTSDHCVLLEFWTYSKDHCDKNNPICRLSAKRGERNIILNAVRLTLPIHITHFTIRLV